TGGAVGGPPWSWGGIDRSALLHWVADSPAAADAIAAGAATLVAARWSAVVGAAGADRSAVLRDLGVAGGAPRRAAGDGHVHVARIDDERWTLGWSLPGRLLGFVSKPAGPLGLAVSIGLGWGATSLADVWQRYRLPGAPPAPDAVERAERQS